MTREEQERSATDRLVAHDVDLDAKDPATGGEDRGGPCALQCVEPAQAALAVADRTEPEDQTREQARTLASEIHQGEEHEADRRQATVAEQVEQEGAGEEHRQERHGDRQAQ